MDATPLLVVVTGAPASGKTGVAERLAAELRVPFLVKDTFKERLYEAFGSDDGVEERVESAALAILFSVAAAQLEAGVSVVAESNFDARTDVGPLRRLAEEHRPRFVQVHCSRDEEKLLADFAERAASGRRHPGHGDSPDDAAEVRSKLEAGFWDALDLPGELLRFDPDRDDERELVERVRAAAPVPG